MKKGIDFTMKKNSYILITGATGAIGADLLPKLLHRYPEHHFIAIVRPKDKKTAKSYLLTAIGDHVSFDADRLTALAGDVAEARFGLDEVPYQELKLNTSKIFHFAANVRFSAGINEARRGNVQTTKNVVAFALDSQVHNENIELHYASTAYIVGKRTGVLLENELNLSQEFWNAYEQSKLEAEELVVESRKNIATTVYRPSQVICISNSGKVRKLFGLLEFLKIALTGKVMFKHIPANPDVRFDMVPIDYVTDAISYLSNQAEAQGKTYHLAAGLKRSLPLHTIIDLIYDTAISYQPSLVNAVKPTCVPLSVYNEMAEKSTAFSTLLELYQTYLEYDRDFQVDETMERLSKSGIVLPPMEDVLQRSVRFLLNSVSNQSRFQ